MTDDLARLDAGISWVQLLPGVDGRAGWVRCSDLCAGTERLVAWQRETAHAYRGGDDDGVLTGQGLVLDWYAAAVTLPGAGLFHNDRRVPDLAPEWVHLLPGPPGAPVAAIALESPRFRCLPGDPAAAEDDATVVDDIDRLAAALRSEVLVHAQRLLAAYSPTTRIGLHGLWGALTDAVDVAFMTGGWVSADMPGAASDARLVLDGGVPPLVGGSTLHEIEDALGRRHWTRRRWSCCLLYRAPGAAACVTCPRVDDHERRRQAAGW